MTQITATVALPLYAGDQNDSYASPAARRKLGKEGTMIRLTLRYARYALTTLSTIGFGNWSN